MMHSIIALTDKCKAHNIDLDKIMLNLYDTKDVNNLTMDNVYTLYSIVNDMIRDYEQIMPDVLSRAIILATKAHAGQYDKGNSPYILHPLHVMHNVTSIDAKIVAVLHDVIEDTDVRYTNLMEIGCSLDQIKAIKLLTKSRKVSYHDYILDIKKNDLARIVKIQDILHNLDEARLLNKTDKDVERINRYKTSLKILLGE